MNKKENNFLKYSLIYLYGSFFIKSKAWFKNILSEIEYHDKKYHDEDDPEISDDEYDKLCKNYDQLIKENQNYNFLPRNKIGYLTSNQFKKYSHKEPMLSLNNAFSIQEVKEFTSQRSQSGSCRWC